MICEQSETRSGGATLGFFSETCDASIVGQIGFAHLRHRVQARVRVVLVGDRGEVVGRGAIFLDVDLRDPPEQFREHEVAVFRLLDVIIRRRAKNIGAIQRRHRLLLFRADDEDRVVKSAHDPLRAEQDGERTGSAGRFGVHRRNAVQFRVDLGNERAEMQLLGELAGVEIAHRRRLDFRRIDLRVVDRFPAGFRDQVADGFAFLLQVALKIGSAAAENVNWFVHKIPRRA